MIQMATRYRAHEPYSYGLKPTTCRLVAASGLTAYGTDLYLVENEIDRWSISDRTPGLFYDDDGSLTITVSATRPVDIANWLPVPNGPYLMGLRVYEGDEAVVSCDWFPPFLTAA